MTKTSCLHVSQPEILCAQSDSHAPSHPHTPLLVICEISLQRSARVAFVTSRCLPVFRPGAEMAARHHKRADRDTGPPRSRWSSNVSGVVLSHGMYRVGFAQVSSSRRGGRAEERRRGACHIHLFIGPRRIMHKSQRGREGFAMRRGMYASAGDSPMTMAVCAPDTAIGGQWYSRASLRSLAEGGSCAFSQYRGCSQRRWTGSCKMTEGPLRTVESRWEMQRPFRMTMKD